MDQDDKYSEWRKLPGPWQGEPDRVDFEAHGLPCLAKRQNLGAWCGYVAVPPGHPLHGKKMNELPGLEVHGGVTYTDSCQGEICHVPKPGEPDDVWWIGFDCAHYCDIVPWISWNSPEIKFEGSEYRDLDYVKQQCIELAEQLTCSSS